MKSDLITFLKKDLALPTPAIDLALRHAGQNLNEIPMVLWQYGFVSLAQLDQIFDWLAMG
jgi:Protein of unknown function (DUF2949)